MEPRFVEKGRITLVGMSFYGDPFAESGGWTEENEIGRLWSRLEAYLADHPGAVKHRTSETTAYEVHVEGAETATKGYREVFVGVKVEQLEDVPVEMVVKILPAATYALFTLEGEQITSDWSMMMQEWMLDAGYEPAHPYGMQRYDERFRGVDSLAGSVLEVYLPVKKLDDVPSDGDR